MNNATLQLAIESSCDESALALFDPNVGIVGEWVYSQMATHERYGGVVPDLASRAHLERFPHLLELALARAKELGASISEIAVTVGPGLAGCLAMGISLAKALSAALEVPVWGANHLLGHAYSPFIPLYSSDPAGFFPSIERYLPHLGLIASGGNTLLFELGVNGAIRILAITQDDAAGEALDKGAKLLGLGYPGGTKIEKLAQSGNPRAYAFPRPLHSPDDLRFSFSGLKTSLRYQLEKMDDAAVACAMDDLCASYQEAVVETLLLKTRQVLEARSGHYRSLGLSGGVANNGLLRAGFIRLSNRTKIPSLIAENAHAADNAAMIAFSAWLEKQFRRSARPLQATPMLLINQ